MSIRALRNTRSATIKNFTTHNNSWNRLEWNQNIFGWRFFDFFKALDITANSICEIQWWPLDGFLLNTVHKQRSKEKKSQWSLPGLQGGKQEYFLWAMQPPFMNQEVFVRVHKARQNQLRQVHRRRAHTTQHLLFHSFVYPKPGKR